MIETEYTLNAYGLSATVPEPYTVLGLFLEDDIQDSLDSCRRLMAKVQEMKTNPSHEPWEADGNAWLLTLSPKGAHIEPLTENTGFEPCELSLEDFDQAVAGWAKFVEEIRP